MTLFEHGLYIDIEKGGKRGKREVRTKDKRNK